MTLFDGDEVLPTNPPIQPLLIRVGFNSKGKRRRTSKARSSRAVAGSIDKDPLSRASAYTNLTLVPPSTSLDVDMFRHVNYARRGGR